MQMHQSIRAQLPVAETATVSLRFVLWDIWATGFRRLEARTGRVCPHRQASCPDTGEITDDVAGARANTGRVRSDEKFAGGSIPGNAR